MSCANSLVTTGAGIGRAMGRITLECRIAVRSFRSRCLSTSARTASDAVFMLGETESGPELVEHLRANSLHYNQAIWRSFDASTVALLLSRFSFEGKPVADLIDPRPIQVAGNYLVFRMPGFVARAGLAPRDDDDTSRRSLGATRWQSWLRDRGLTFARDASRNSSSPFQLAASSPKPCSAAPIRRRSSTSRGSGTGKIRRFRCNRRRSRRSTCSRAHSRSM